MSLTDPTSGIDRNPVEMLAEEFVDRQRRGEHPSLTEYTGKYPELAEEIRDLFPALVMMEQLKPAGPGMPGSFGGEPASPAYHLASPMGRLGDYRLLREVARGGMGVVYEAVQESLGRHVALKVLPMNGRLSATQIERFQLEARSAARLHHGNIVPVHGVGEYQGVHYYAMQFIQGHPVDAILDDLRQLRGLGEQGGVGRPAPSAAAPGTDDGTTLAICGPTRSLLLARSLVTGAFEKGDDRHGDPSVSAAPASLPTMTDATVAEAGLPPGAQIGPVPARLSEPVPATAGWGSSDTSSLSLTTESQFYRSVARIGLQVADALAYAHHQGVLHRDIKPSNLLLDAAGNVWVTDFGLAKIEGSDGPTRTGDIVGTIRYMAPERFDGWSDRRSDIYSLGTTLYELVTLQPLFPRAAQAELIEKVLHEAPDPPRKFDPKIPRDLETIVLKAIAKEPADRYPTAQALGDDLRRFLEDRPVQARRSTPVEQFWRWCRRNRWLAAASMAAAGLTMILAIGATVTAWTFHGQRVQIEGQRDQISEDNLRIRRAENETREKLFEALTAQARVGRFSHRVGQRFASLDALAQATEIARELNLPPQKLDPLRDETIACLALPDLKTSGQVIPRPPGVLLFAFDPTMTRYALRFRDGTIQVRRVADDQEVARFQARGDREVSVLSFSPDGRYLVTTHFPGGGLTVWDIAQCVVAVNDLGPVGGHWVRFSPDSRRIALVHERSELLVYDLANGKPSKRWRVPEPGDLSFRPDGTQIAVICGEKNSSCRILDSETGRIVRSIPMPTRGEWVAWSPDGTTLATPCNDRKIYLWDAASGIRRATLEGHVNWGLFAAFHPTGALVASNDWNRQIRVWDPVLGRTWLTLAGIIAPEFSRDGRIVVSLEDKLTQYQVDPALEYRTFAHAVSEPSPYARASIHRDGRVLAVGTSRGVALWELARGTELAFLPIGSASHLLFEESGELLTSGVIGMWRWPIQLDPDRQLCRIGPPRQLRSFPPGDSGIAEDRSGQVVALAGHGVTYVLTPERAFQIRPLDDVRSVAVSPDGQWLVTGSHGHNGAQVWRVRDGARITDLAIEGLVELLISPDGKWLMSSDPPCRLWEVGTWREARRIGGHGLGFSPDGRLLVVQDESKVIRLVEAETGRTVARLESPDLCDIWWATFSPDGSRLVVTANEGPAVHVWDLRAIRRHLAGLGLDWDAPAFSENDPADLSAPPLPQLQVDLGPLAGHTEHFTESPETLVQRYSLRLKDHPNEAEAYHHRAHAHLRLGHHGEGIDDLTQAIRLRPGDAHLRTVRGKIHEFLKHYEPAIADLEAALVLQPDQPVVRELLALCCNNRAWELATGPDSRRDVGRALAMAERAVALAPGQQAFLNTQGVLLYRAGRFAESITTLERSLAAGRGQFDAFDLFFLAMAHHRLGHREEAHRCFDRAVSWLGEQKNLVEQYAKELAAFRAEAEAVLTGSDDELPADVFAVPR